MERQDENNKRMHSDAALQVGARFRPRGYSLLSQLTGQGCIVAGLGLMASLSVASAADQPSPSGQPARVRFNTSFIQGSDQPADLKAFLEGNSVVPGTYRVDVYINRTLSGRRDISFKANPVSGAIEPCLSTQMMAESGLDMDRIKPAATDQPAACFDLAARVEFARVDYQPSSLRLNISVPQAMMSRRARGYVPPELWDEGETTGFSNYNFSGARRSNRGQRADQYYLGLRNGLNLGAWRLRNESSLVYGDAQPYRFRSNRTFVQRDVTALSSQLTLGETFTDSQVFDSVRFLGAMLASDDGMLPDSERIYAPVIRGIAQSNATVEVRQNNFMLYSGNVSPGPFEISDIYPSGSNGDLEVTVIEADGSRRVFVQAYASLPIMVPAGALRYSVATGEYDGNEGGASPTFTSATLIYGLTDYVTGAGGLQLAEDFQASNIGAGINTGVGAVSVDLTQSVSEQRQRRYSGRSLRVRYANTLDLTHTTLAVAGYRYSTEDYRTLEQHVDETGPRIRGFDAGRAKDRVELSLTQTLPGSNGSLSLTGSEQRYWDRSSRARQFYLSWNSAWRSLSYNLSLERNQIVDRDGQGQTDHRIAMSLSLPLGDNAGASRLSFNTVRDAEGEYSAQAGLNGQVFDDRNTFYSLQGGHDQRSGASGFGNINTTRSWGRFDVGYGQGQDYRALSLGAAGSVVAHAGGVNFGQTLGETFALVQVKDVAGAKIKSYGNIETASNGYAVLPYAQPYRTNWISLDTRQLGADVDLDNAVTQVVPRRGAVPRVAFKASVGRRVQLALSHADGSALPFGAVVEDEHGNLLATVDPTGQALVLNEQDTAVLNVRWADQHCQVRYALSPKNPQRAYERVKAVCQ